MPGRIISVPVRNHTCSGMPEPEQYPRGTQWRCSECKQVWVVVEGAQYNESYSAWRKLTERNRDGRDNS